MAQEASAAETPWRVVVYADGVLSSDRSISRAARAIADEAGRLTALGAVEVVLAAPEPEVRLGPTRDPKLVADALEEVAHERPPGGELLWHREEVRKSLAEAPRFDSEALRRRVLGAAALEATTIQARVDTMLRRLQEIEARPGAPKLVLWIADGFDPDPAEFYLDLVRDRQLRDVLRGDLEPYGTEAAVSHLADALARAGWVVVPVSPGLRPFGLSDGEDLFVDPREPLRRIAAGTGGDAKGGTLAEILERLSDASPEGMTNQASGADPGESVPPLPVGSPLDAAALGLVSPRALYLLPPEEPMATGRTRLAVQTLDPAVAKVTFHVEGEEPRIDTEPPFEVTVDLPMIPRTTRVEAVAVNAANHEIGRDSTTLNPSEGELRVTFREPREIPSPGSYSVEVDVGVPKGAGVPTITLAWNGEPVAEIEHPPYRETVEVPPGVDSGYLQATATLPDGRSSEAVLTFGPKGFRSRVAVQLVELPTVVENRRGRPVPGLERDDFRVREDDREQTLRDFATASDVPLSVGLALDVSTSLEEDLPLVREAAATFLDRVLRPTDRAQVVAFAGRPWLAAPLTGEPGRLARAIDELDVDRNTSLYDALMLSLYELRGAAGRRALVVLTDGVDTHSKHRFEQCAEFARRVGIPIYAVVVGSPATRDPAARLHRWHLERLATDTGGGLHFVQSLDHLPAVYEEIAEELRHQYFLTYAPDRDTDRPGWRRVVVDVLRDGLRAKTVAGYFDED